MFVQGDKGCFGVRHVDFDLSVPLSALLGQVQILQNWNGSPIQSQQRRAKSLLPPPPSTNLERVC